MQTHFSLNTVPRLITVRKLNTTQIQENFSDMGKREGLSVGEKI
jgi:hypothetical protein